MMRFSPVPEPPKFDTEARQPGNAWLQQHPGARRPPDYWSQFRDALADGFNDLCGYCVMHDQNGTVDHYLSYTNDPDLTYEWSNYRYVSGRINSSKQNIDEQVLDPFEVEDGWFEILLPSLQMVVTDAVPEEHRERAEFTLQRLRLGSDEVILRRRRAWYSLFASGKLSLEGLRVFAPLIARAVETSSSQHPG